MENKTYNVAIRQLIKNHEVEQVIEDLVKSRNMDRLANYLPHHGFFKFDRISKKYCVVFDASAKNCEGVSLNCNLLPGTKIQSYIALLLINVRLHPFTLEGDIT